MSGLEERIREHLFELREETYREFQAGLMPTVPKESVIGVRTPILRKYAKELRKTEPIEEFLEKLPHSYYEENNLHMFLLEEEKDFQSCIQRLEAFLPYVDNWSTCDTRPPKIFAKHKEELIPYVEKWMASEETYVIRYAMNLLMRFFLDEAFEERYPKLVAEKRKEDYYVKMGAAWYFATALAKQYEQILPYLEERRLETWTHNKTIQKAIESYRITPEQKSYLKTLKIS